MGKHLDLNARIEIQKGLSEGKSFTDIAKIIDKNKSTIYREVMSKRKYVSHKDTHTIQTKNACVNRYKCDIKNLCKSPTCFKRTKNCTYCGNCNHYCNIFKEEICSLYDSSPYVCNPCDKKPRCPLSKWIYEAKSANDEYETLLSTSREGVSLNEEELIKLDNIVSPLLKKGQSIRFICSNKSDELMVSDKTIYNYISIGLLDADKFDLRRTVQRKERKKAGPPVLIDRQCRIGRIYEDFKRLMSDNSDTAVVEMDSVEGIKGGKVLLTLLFRNCNLQLAFLRDSNDSKSVSEVFKKLRTVLGSNEFRLLFPVILTDRGSEFSDPSKIEIDFGTGEIQSKLFYCDPQNSSQKAFCERNHEFIRYILPKGVSLDKLTQKDIDIMMNHINSYGREKYNYKSPIKLFNEIYGTEISKKLGIQAIPADEITLKPELLRK